MTGTVLSTPEAKPEFVSCPDTTQSQYLSGDLNEGRLAVLMDLRRYRLVPYERLVRSRFRIFPENSKIVEIRRELKANGLITQDDKQWSAFVNNPSTDESMEPSIFNPLYPIISEIFGQVPESSFHFVATPSEAPCSTRRNTSCPNAYVKCQTPYLSNGKTHWFDIAVPFEFKKSDDGGDRYDNAQNVIWSLRNIMREDPLRRFALGITIEGTNMRIWYHDWALLSVSTSIDFTTEIDHVVSLFYLMAQQTKVGLGWDPTVERTSNGQYKFMVDGKCYTTTKELAMFGADLMVGSGTQVYEAEDEEKKKVAIKDSWRSTDRDHEGLVTEKILQDIRNKFGEAELTTAKNFLVAVRAYEDVHISGKPDETLNPGTHGIWIKINSYRALSERFHLPSLPSTGHIPGSDQCIPYSDKDENIPCRLHARIVFDDVGTSLMNVPILHQSLSCLYDALQGLRYVHLAGWVHRDISVANVLRVEDRANPGNFTGKLMDFEFAKRINSDISHEAQTGTLHFLAAEVEIQHYLFCLDLEANLLSDAAHPFTSRTSNVSASVPPSPPPFCMNPLHDLESAWWIVIWILFYHTDKESPTGQADAQLELYKQAFPGTIGQMSRLYFFTHNFNLCSAYETLSATYSKKCDIFQKLAYVLKVYYMHVESQPSLVPMCDDDLEAVYREILGGFKEAITRLKEPPIQLESLSKSKKRTVNDLPTHQTRKRTKYAPTVPA